MLARTGAGGVRLMELLHEEIVEDVLRAGPSQSAAALRDRILEAQRAFTGRTDTEDDRTLLVLRIDGAVSASA